eukprot:15096-Eustigmatos_ZCMA.PRE.1
MFLALSRRDVHEALTLIVMVIQLRERYAKGKYIPTDLRYKKTRAIRRRLTKHEVREAADASTADRALVPLIYVDVVCAVISLAHIDSCDFVHEVVQLW